MSAEDLFEEIVNSIPDASTKKMFGAVGLKLPNGKVPASLHENNMIFKLPDNDIKQVLAWENTSLFEPMKGKPPMKNWVQVPIEHGEKWRELTEKAIIFVSE